MLSAKQVKTTWYKIAEIIMLAILRYYLYNLNFKT